MSYRRQIVTMAMASVVALAVAVSAESGTPPVTARNSEAQDAPPVFFAANEELRAYVLEACASHPELHAGHAEWLAALDRIPQVTALDDPMLTYGQFVQSDTYRFKVMLEQRFPWFGTLRAKGAVAAREADAKLQEVSAARNRIIGEVKRAYFNYGYLSREQEVTQDHIDVLGYAEETVRAKYALGIAAQADVLRIQIEQTKVTDRLAGLDQSRPALSAQLCEALGRISSEYLPWPQGAPFPPAPPPPPIVLARVHTNNPELKVFDHMIEGRQAQAKLARKMGFPELGLGLEYMSMKDPPLQTQSMTNTPSSGMNGTGAAKAQMENGTGNMTVMSPLIMQPPEEDKDPKDDIVIALSMSLPIWRKRVRAGIAEAQHMEEAAGHDKTRTARALEAAARMTLYQFADAQRRYTLYDASLLPQARAVYTSVQTAYATGEPDTSFLDLLDSVQALLDLQLEQIAAGRDLQLAAADLEYLMGGPWSEPAEHRGD